MCMKSLVFCVLITSTVFLFAQEEITLEKAVSYARSQNRSISIQRYALEQAKRDRNTAWTSLYPSVNASADIIEWKRIDATNTPVQPGQPAPTTAIESLNLNVGVSASFTFFPAVISQIRSAYLQYENQEISFNDFQNQLELQVRRIYFDLLLLKEIQALLQQQYDQVIALLESVEQSYASGYTSELEVLQLQLRADSLRLELERQKSIYARAVPEFAVLLGIDTDEEVVISENIAEYAVNPDLLDAVTQVRGVSLFDRADIRLTEQRMDLNKVGKNLNTLQLFPSIMLSYQYGGTLNEIDSADSYYTDLHQVRFSVVWNLSHFLPLSSVLTGIANAGTQKTQLEEQLVSQIQDANLAIDRLIGEIDRGFKTLEERRLNVDLAEELYALTLEAYENGSVNYDSLRQAELDLLSQRQFFVTERVSLLKSAFDLAYQAQVDFDMVYIKRN